jgi:FixJ family two-component response regulator
MSQQIDPTVFVIDDDDAVRGALELLLKSVRLRVETFASAADFLTRFDPEDPGCVLLDIRMAGMSGLELYEDLRRRHAIIPIIFITGHGDVDMAVQAMKDGAADFIQKPFHDQTLLDRIQKSLEIDSDNRKLLAQKQKISDRILQLTPRETEVMDLIVDGRPNKVVAHDLGISERTVEIHRARVMKKLGATSLAHLVRMCIRARK